MKRSVILALCLLFLLTSCSADVQSEAASLATSAEETELLLPISMEEAEEPQIMPEPELEPESIPESVPADEAESASEPEPTDEAEPLPEPESETEQEPEPKVEAEPEPVPEPEPEPEPVPEPVSVERDYVLNTNSKKFHVPDCSSVSQMKDKNRLDVHMSRESIISQGYDPCKRCKP